MKLKKNPSPKDMRLATTVFFFISGFGYATWASRIPTLQQQLHLNEAQLGGILFALPVGLLITLPVTSDLLGRFAGRSIMLFGSLFFNIVLCVLGFVKQSWQLIAILFCFGSSRNLLNLSMNAQSIGVQGLYSRSIVTGFHGIWSLAGFAGAGVGYLMVRSGVSPEYHFLFVGVFMIFLTLVYYPSSYYQKPERLKRKRIFAFPDASMLKFALICFASLACENTMYDWSGIYFQKVVHASKAVATGGFVMYMIAMTGGRFGGDFIVGRVGIKNMLRWSGIFISSGLLLAVIFPYAFPVSFGFVLVGFGVSCIVPLVFNIAGQSNKSNSGSAIASVSTIGYFGFLAVPPMIGFIAQSASLQWSFGIISTLGLLIIWMVSKI